MTGNNGILTKAIQAIEQTKLAEIEETMNLELFSGNFDSLSKENKLSELVKKSKERGYDIEQTVMTNGTIEDILLEKSSLLIYAETEGTINVTYDGILERTVYFAKLNGKYYEITLNDNREVKVNRMPTKVTENTSELEAEVTSGDSVTKVEVEGNIVTVTAGNNTGKSTITVKYGSIEKTCEVSVIKIPSETSTENPATTFSTEYGRIDVVWLDINNNIIPTPAPPILNSNGEKMTPVTWTKADGENGKWSEDATAQTSWYNYTAGTGTEDNLNSKWANAKTNNGSYFVWIPRYAYRITYYENETSTEPTGYYDGWGMYDAVNANLKYKITEADGIKTVNYNGTKYIVHPAFEENVDAGGWGTNLTGFWFAKYEMSGSGNETSSTDTLKSVPEVDSLRNKSIGTQYLFARNANYGYIGKAETITSNKIYYTHTNYMNSHLVKNSEWGAVAYLTHSQYGRNGHEIDINNSSSCITGNGGGSTNASAVADTTNAYNTVKGAKASTTGNIYGIYDMSGGVWEHTSSYDKRDSSTYLNNSGSGGYMIQEAKDSNGNYVSTKYVTAYENGTNSNYGNAIIYKVGKIGDATKEVNTGAGYSNTSTSQYYNWFSDYPNIVGTNHPFFFRGGWYDNESFAGVFYTSVGGNGSGGSAVGFRTVLCP